MSSLYDQVWQRASNCCEYCQMPQALDAMTFEVDHIIPLKVGGPTEEHNLALACDSCNKHKDPNLAGIDTEGDQSKAIQCFIRAKMNGHSILNGTDRDFSERPPTGRATLVMLQINLALRVEHREWLIAEGSFPSS